MALERCQTRECLEDVPELPGHHCAMLQQLVPALTDLIPEQEQKTGKIGERAEQN